MGLGPGVREESTDSHSGPGWTDSALGTRSEAELVLALGVDGQEQPYFSLDSQGLGAGRRVLSRYIVASQQRL